MSKRAMSIMTIEYFEKFVGLPRDSLRDITIDHRLGMIHIYFNHKDDTAEGAETKHYTLPVER